MKPLIIYHGDCNDGFGAAFAAYLKYGDNADYFPGMYNGKIPDVSNRDVLIFDYHFKEQPLKEMANKARSLILKDHHYSAELMLSHLPYAQFDNSKSGAVLAWEHFFDSNIPEMFLWIQDRDLFENKYEESKYFYYYINSKEYNFKEWLSIYDKLKTKDGRLEVLVLGKSIFEFYNVQKDLIIKHYAKMVEIEGIKGWIVNTNRLFATEIGNELASRTNSFALIWSLSNKGTIACSVRSVGASSAREIAEKFGGGGHKHAAKFVMSVEEFMNKFIKN